MQTFYITFGLGDNLYHRAIKATNALEAHAQWSAYEAGVFFVSPSDGLYFVSLSTRKTRGFEYQEGW